MNTRVILESDLKAAMRANDDVTRRTIRMVLSAVKLAEIEKQSSLDENTIQTILQKEIKSRRESSAEAERAGRLDIVQDASAEIKVLEKYLPQQLTENQLIELVDSAVAEVDARTPADIGKVMKVLMPRIQGRASGDRVNLTVRNALQKD